ncbi:MAG TPA: hypothetical protein VGH19_06925 [Verrucomicrobiae bacterium]
MNKTNQSPTIATSTEVGWILVVGLCLFFLTDWKILGGLLIFMSIVGIGSICQRNETLNRKIKNSPTWLKVILSVCFILPVLFLFYFSGAVIIGITIATIIPFLFLAIPIAIFGILLAILSKH